MATNRLYRKFRKRKTFSRGVIMALIKAIPNKEDRKGNAEQLERLTNSELQKLFVNDKAGGKEQVREKKSHKNHLKNLRNLHEESRGKHGNIRHDK